ncbi:Talin-2 [Xenoophorus captivus]|uniref:Talin-2 n=1 Tax=Xenoophorus captivus TaxID=1517983 RepID=A0ABV0QQB2_9TELE
MRRDAKDFVFALRLPDIVFLHLLPGDPTDTDYTAVGCAITTISSNLTEMSKGVKLLAALMEDDVGGGNDLMKAARTLAGAVSDLLKAVEPTSGEVRNAFRTSRVKFFCFSHT